MGHKTYGSRVQFGLASSFASTTALLARSIEGAQPIRSEKIKQWRRDRPRSNAPVLRAAPASIVEAYKLFDLIGLFNAATWFPVRDSQNKYTLRALQLYEFHTAQ